MLAPRLLYSTLVWIVAVRFIRKGWLWSARARRAQISSSSRARSTASFRLLAASLR
jgi:hypothetical protein